MSIITKHKPRKIFAAGVFLVAFLLVASFGMSTVSNAVYCWATGDWGPIVGTFSSAGVTVVFGASAMMAAGGATSFVGALEILAAYAGPIGWLILGGIITGV